MNNTPDWDVLYQKSEKLTPETFEFVFSEAQEFLSANIQIADSFKTRAITALSFLTPTILAIIGYILLLSSFPMHVIIPVGTSLVFLTASAYYCLKVINTKSSYFMGCQPSTLLSSNFVEDRDKQKHDLFFTQCEQYEMRSKQRIEQNNALGGDFKLSVRLMLISPIAAIFWYLLILGLGWWYSPL